jgi:hypothetical protein
MAITSGSRYEQSIVDYFRKKEGGTTYPIVFYSFDNLDNISFYYHTYRTGETLQGISQKLLGTPNLWWAIAEYNPEVTDFVHIADGTLMRIPSV